MEEELLRALIEGARVSPQQEQLSRAVPADPGQGVSQGWGADDVAGLLGLNPVGDAMLAFDTMKGGNEVLGATLLLASIPGLGGLGRGLTKGFSKGAIQASKKLGKFLSNFFNPNRALTSAIKEGYNPYYHERKMLLEAANRASDQLGPEGAAAMQTVLQEFENNVEAGTFGQLLIDLISPTRKSEVWDETYDLLYSRMDELDRVSQNVLEETTGELNETIARVNRGSVSGARNRTYDAARAVSAAGGDAGPVWGLHAAQGLTNNLENLTRAGRDREATNTLINYILSNRQPLREGAQWGREFGNIWTGTAPDPDEFAAALLEMSLRQGGR